MEKRVLVCMGNRQNDPPCEPKFAGLVAGCLGSETPETSSASLRDITARNGKVYLSGIPDIDISSHD